MWRHIKEMYNYDHLIKKLKEKNVYSFFEQLKEKKIIKFKNNIHTKTSNNKSVRIDKAV